MDPQNGSASSKLFVFLIHFEGESLLQMLMPPDGAADEKVRRLVVPLTSEFVRVCCARVCPYSLGCARGVVSVLCRLVHHVSPCQGWCVGNAWLGEPRRLTHVHDKSS